MNNFNRNRQVSKQNKPFKLYAKNNSRMFTPNAGNYTQNAGNFTPNVGQNNCSPYNKPYFSDQSLLNRVNQYLQNFPEKNVDFDHMVDELQREFFEYRRKKRAAFKHQLRKAVEVVVLENSYNQDDEEVIEDDEEENSDVRGRKSPDYALEGDGDVNSALENSYTQQNAKKSRKLSDSVAQELISIVTSDEDNNDTGLEQKSTEPLPPKEDQPPDAVTEQVMSTPVAKPEAAETQTSKKRRMEMPLPGSKRFKTSLEPVRPSVSFKDIGGNEKVLQEVTQLLIHMRHPEVYRVLGVSPPRGFLLHGPPGSGKTLLANAIAGELKTPLLKVAAPELVGGLSGQSEERIRELFEQAVALAPCILFIDEVDAITPNRETAHREMERRIVAQLLSSLDELSNSENGDQVLVIGATNRPDSLDPALRRAGRFDREVCLGIPDRESRMSILQTLCRTLRLDPDLQLAEVAMMTPGYVGADIKALVTEAAMAAVNRLFKDLKKSENESQSKPLVIEQSREKTIEPSIEEKDAVPPAVGEVMIVEEGEEKDAVPPAVGEVMIVEEGSGDKDVKQTRDANTDQPDKLQEVSESKNDNKDIQVVPLDNDDTNSDEVQVLSVAVKHNTDHSHPSLLHSSPLSVEQLKGVYIKMSDFKQALKAVQPSAKREGFATVPDVKWDDIGSLQDIRHELQMAILAPVKYPKEFETMGLHMPTGVLLCGPPGCGKTLLAKAVANEAGINFISVKGPELLNMYVGESERAVRQCFQRARSSQPCVIFFDEIDALCPKRNNMENGASRVVNQLLTEMDGMEARPGVFLMAATNRPDIVDPAVMRPGRLDKILYVGLPSASDRVDILRALTKGGKQPVLDTDVDLTAVGENSRCDGYTGADLAALVREASMQALKEFMASSDKSPIDLRVCGRHFTIAMENIRPSVSVKDKKRYEDLRLQYAAVPNSTPVTKIE